MKDHQSIVRVLRCALLAVMLVALSTSSANADIRLCTWNVLQLSSSDTTDATRVTALRTVLAQIDPDILVIQEIQGSTASVNFLNNVLNGSGGPGGPGGDPNHYERASFATLGGGLDNALYYRSALFTEIAADFDTLNTSPRDTPIWRMRPADDPSGASDLYVYSMHLKAGSSGSDEDDRAVQATAVRNHANNLPAGTDFVYLGDFNVNSSSEAAYVDFIGSQGDNDGRAFDPIDQPGTWSDNPSFAAIHTQSPINNSPIGASGAAGGGMDDRFDFILISDSLQDGSGTDYIANSYTTYGNDGLHYNDDINDPPTIPEGSIIADALVRSSDHLPVYLDLTEPVGPAEAQLTPTGVIVFDVALVGGISEKTYTLSNTATPPAEDLVVNLTTIPAGFVSVSGAGPFVIPAGSSTDVVIRRASDAPGIALGTLAFSTNDPSTPTLLSSINGSIRAKARPSVSDMSETFAAVAAFNAMPDMLNGFEVEVFQFDYTPLAVPLEVYDASFDANPSGRFAVDGFVPVGGITDMPAEIGFTFDSMSAPAGDYTATLRLLTRDDSMLSGASNLADLTYDLTVTIDGPLLGDFDQNGVVDTADIPGMVALLLDPAAASTQDQAIGDLNQDAVNDATDIAGFVDAMLN